MLFADLLSLHLITFLTFLILEFIYIYIYIYIYVYMVSSL